MLAIVRHAESERNKAKMGRTYFADEYARKDVKGIPDHNIALTPLGAEQAKKTGVVLRERFGTFDYAYHSGYLRTEQTLENILAAWPEEERKNIKIRSNPFIRERDAGYTYEMTEDEAERYFPWLQDYWKTFGGFFGRPVGGESLAQVAERVYLFINMLFRERMGKRVLIITHGGTIRAFRFLLEHWNYERALRWSAGEEPKNCGLTVYESDKDGQHLELKEYNTIYWG